MHYIIITGLAALGGVAALALAWAGPQSPQGRSWVARWQQWRTAQGIRLKALGATAASSQLGWRPPLIGLGLGLALGLWLQLSFLALMGLALGVAWPRLLEARLRAQRLERLAAQLPSLFESLASALRSGQSLTQALASSVEDLPEPSSQLMEEVLRRVRLGDQPEDALQAVGVAVEQSPMRADWRMLSTAVAVVRSSGGRLPEILDQLAVTVRERQRLQAQVQAQTAQAKLSGWVIGCLPPALLLAMQALDPELTAPLFNSGPGWAILAGAVALEGAGLFLLKRMAQVAV
jgi:tight adherence protein B